MATKTKKNVKTKSAKSAASKIKTAKPAKKAAKTEKAKTKIKVKAKAPKAKVGKKPVKKKASAKASGTKKIVQTKKAAVKKAKVVSKPASKSSLKNKKKMQDKVHSKKSPVIKKSEPAKKASPVSKKQVGSSKVTKPQSKPTTPIVSKASQAMGAGEKKPSKVKAKAPAPKLTVVKSEGTSVHSAPSRESQTSTGYLVGIDLPPYQEVDNEEYMNDMQQEHFRKILIRWKEQLMQEMNRTVHHLQDEAVNLPDPNDRASQEEEFSLELRARDRERKLIKKIEDALQKIEEGEYGYCDSCGVEIGIRRLEARPTANLCIDCKTLDEIRERQMGG